MHQNRVPCPRHPTLGLSLRRSDSQKWPHILAFFWFLYISTAEVLPTKFVMPSEEIQKRHEVDGTADDFDERYVQSFLKNIDAQFAVPVLISWGRGVLLVHVGILNMLNLSTCSISMLSLKKQMEGNRQA